VAITEYSKYIKMFAKELTKWDGYHEPKPRKFLQDFGFYIRHKSEQPNYFIERMKEDIKIYETFLDVLIISDVRFPNEIEEMNGYHPLTIHVQNDIVPKDLTKEEMAHETEHALDHYQNFHYNIINQSKKEIHLILNKIIEMEKLV